jgi:hypothetical protein
MKQFHREWETWLAKAQGCMFPRHKKSVFYHNKTFDNDSAAALALCWANVRQAK